MFKFSQKLLYKCNFFFISVRNFHSLRIKRKAVLNSDSARLRHLPIAFFFIALGALASPANAQVTSPQQAASFAPLMSILSLLLEDDDDDAGYDPGAGNQSIPAAPLILDALIRADAIYLNWPNADGRANNFRVIRNGNTIQTVTSPPYVDTAVIKGATYKYSVRACNNFGCSKAVSTSVVMTGTVGGGGASPGVRVVDGYEYNVLGRLIKVNENGATKTQYEYDSAGNRKRVIE